MQRMIVIQSMHPEYLSNAYLVAGGPGGDAVIIDAGAPIEPLLAAAAEHDLTITHLLLTHDHHDHIEHADALVKQTGCTRIDAGELTGDTSLRVGDLTFTGLDTPGHIAVHTAYVVDGDAAVFTGDVLFAGTVGGTLSCGPDGYDLLQASIMDVLMSLPDETVVYPGHTDATTIGDERKTNPFIRLWSGVDEPGSEAVTVLGEPARMLLWAPDYDGGNKALVELAGDVTAIVGGSRVDRSATPAG